MRNSLVLILALGCAGDDTGADSGGARITAAAISTSPEGTATAHVDIEGVILEDAQGPGDVTYEFRWLSDGGATWATPTLPSTATTRGESWTLTVTPYVGPASGPTSETSVDIVNAAPTLDGAGFTPAQPAIGSNLTCVAINPNDLDGDPLTFTYAWTVAGEPLSETTNTLAASLFGVGEEITCSVTASDGEATSETRTVTGSATNSTPTSTGSEISPPSPLSTEDLTCTGLGGDDADGDPITWEYVWYVNGSEVTGQTGATLAASFFGPDDTVNCLANPSDGIATGEGVVSANTTILNTPPVATGATISPEQPRAGDSLSCAPDGNDPDGLPLDWTYVWTVNNVPGTPQPSDFFIGALVYQDTVMCTAIADDGTDTASVDSAVVTVVNSPPVLSGISISPASPTAADPLTCSLASATDPDGQAFTPTFEWDVGGTTYAGPTLSAGTASRGDLVTCTATATDGLDDATPVSTSVNIRNAAPTQPTITFDPPSPTHYDAITCVASPTLDADNDAVTYTYAWKVGTQVLAETSDTLSAETAGVIRGAVVECTATPTDSEGAGGPAGTGTVTIGNAAPDTPTVNLGPPTATAASALQCNANPQSDVDGDSVTYTYAWFADGNPVVGGADGNLPAGTILGNQVARCEATGSDGTLDSPVGSAELTIGNTLPTVTSVSLSDSLAYETTVVSCNATGSDIDGVAPSFTWGWRVNGSDIGRAAQDISGGSFNAGDTIQCAATPIDGTTGEPGTTVASGTLRISNSLPAVTTPTVTPTAPQAQADDLVCSFSIGIDPDGGNPTADVIWEFQNYQGVWGAWTLGVENSGAGGRTNDAVNAADTVAGRAFRCTVRVTDAQGGVVTAGPSPARFVNSPPSCPADVYNNTTQSAGPYDAYGQCFYLGKSAATCDRVCADAGLANVSTAMHSAWPDACTVAGGNPGEPSDWFRTHGNPVQPNNPYSYPSAGLGYQIPSGTYTGKCFNGAVSAVATFPGEPSDPVYQVATVCACGTETRYEYPTPAVAGSAGQVVGAFLSVTRDTGTSEFVLRADFGSPAGCTLDWWALESETGGAPWATLKTGRLPALGGLNDYPVVQGIPLYRGKFYAIVYGSTCSWSFQYATSAQNVGFGTANGSVFTNPGSYTAYASTFSIPLQQNNVPVFTAFTVAD